MLQTLLSMHRHPRGAWLMTGWLAACVPAQALEVPGDANPNLAGRAPGYLCCLGDSAPAQAAVEVPGLALVAGEALQFTVSGQVHFQAGMPAGNTPDGNQAGSMTTYGNGISAPLSIRFDALVGVFLTAASPSGSATPAALDFSGGLNFATLSPDIGQIFFIGDGLTSDALLGDFTGNRQSFIVPAGATRLFLGTSDGFGWFNNIGSFEVAVARGDDGTDPGGGPNGVPEPGTLALLAAAAVACRRRAA